MPTLGHTWYAIATGPECFFCSVSDSYLCSLLTFLVIQPSTCWLYYATLSLFLYLAVFGSMYRNPYLTKLEFLFHTNILLTAAVTLYARFTGGNQEVVAHTFVSIPLVSLGGILCHHFLLVLKTYQFWTWIRKLRPLLCRKLKTLS